MASEVVRPPYPKLAAYTKSHGIEWRDYALELEARAAALCDAMDKAGLDTGGTWLQGALEELRAILPKGGTRA